MAVKTQKAEPHQNLCSWEAALLPGFLCFILDTFWVKIEGNYDRDPLLSII
jgi:hypothetical protein